MPASHPRTLLAVTLLAALVLAALAAGGCQSSLPDDEAQAFYPAADDAAFEETARDSVLAALRSIDQTALREAFGRLPAYAYTRRTRTEQLTPDGATAARSERVVRHRPGADSFALVQERTTGTFDFGWLGSLVAPTPEQQALGDAAAHVLPDAPAYLSVRSQSAYAFRFLPDTTLWERPVQVISLRVRPEAEQTPSLRRARLYVDRRTRQLLAADVTRAGGAALFDETTRSYLSLRPAPDSGWVPHRTWTRTRFNAPLRAPQHLRTASAYAAYER